MNKVTLNGSYVRRQQNAQQIIVQQQGQPTNSIILSQLKSNKKIKLDPSGKNLFKRHRH